MQKKLLVILMLLMTYLSLWIYSVAWQSFGDEQTLALSVLEKPAILDWAAYILLYSVFIFFPLAIGAYVFSHKKISKYVTVFLLCSVIVTLCFVYEGVKYSNELENYNTASAVEIYQNN